MMLKSKFVFLILVGCFVGEISMAQTWTNHTLSYKGAALLSNGHIGIGSSDGYYQITTNSGKNWTRTTRLPSYSTFYNIGKLYQYNQDTLYAYNDYKLIRTTNGGYDWNTLTAPGVNYILGYAFFDDTSGTAVGIGSSNRRILRTSNGAMNWSLTTATSLNFRGIEKINNTTAIIHGGALLKTTDKGKSWYTTTVSGKTISDIIVVANASPLVYAFEFSATTAFFVSTNSGETWGVKRTFPNESVQSATFESSSTGWVGTYEGNLYLTTNAGNSWTKALNVCNSIQSIVKQGNTLLVSGPFGNIYRSLNKGITWEQLGGSQSCYNDRFTNTYSLTDSVSFAIGGDGTNGFIVRSSNGGRTYPKVTYTGKQLNDIKFLNAMEGIMVGNAGGIYKTLDSGKTWSPITTTITSNLTFACYPSKDTIYVASKTEIWYSFTNGSTWTKSVNPFSFGGDNITGIEFINGKTGFLTTNLAAVRKTTDAASTWSTARYITSNVTYYGLAFHVPSQQGIVMGSGYSSRSNDLGTTWLGTFQSSYSALEYYKEAQFLTNQIVYAINSTNVYRSVDGGYAWSAEPTEYLSTPLGMHVSSSGKALVVSSFQIMSKKDQGNGIPTYAEEFVSEDSQGKSAAWHVFPNPAKDFIRIENVAQDHVFSVYDAMGKEVKSNVASPISVTDLPSGCYVIRGNGLPALRFLKE